MSNSDAHTREERAAVRWWRKKHPEHAKARLEVVRENGTVFSYLVMPKDPTLSYRRQPKGERAVVSLDEIADAYEPVRRAALSRLNAKQDATGIIVNVTEWDILREALRAV